MRETQRIEIKEEDTVNEKMQNIFNSFYKPDAKKTKNVKLILLNWLMYVRTAIFLKERE